MIIPTLKQDIARNIERHLSLGLIYGFRGGSNFKAMHSDLLFEDTASQEKITVILVQECERFGIGDKFLIERSIASSMSYFKKYYPKSVFRKIKNLKSKRLSEICREVESQRVKFLKEMGT